MLLLLLLAFRSLAVNLTGVGSPVYWPVIQNWADSYTLINPDFHINFEPSANGAAGINQIALGPEVNHTIDFVMIDGSSPNSTQYEVGLQAFPFTLTEVVCQVNFAFKKNIIINSTVMADIFLGKITNWADPKLVELNQNLTMPNATIWVFYRSDMNTGTAMLSWYLQTHSPEWAAYGTVISFPADLRNKTNFRGFPDLISLNGAVASTPNSIAYVQYYSVVRDPSLHYALMIHNVTGKPVSADGNFAGADFMTLNTRLEAGGARDAPDPHAWPMLAVVAMMVPTRPTDCEKAREMYKFIRWSLTDVHPRHALMRFGGYPLGSNLTNTALAALSKIMCDGQSVAAYVDETKRGPIDYLFFVISNLVLVLGLILSSLHIYHFRNSQINLVYSSIFVLGVVLTLLSPIFWWINPTTTGICQGRIWTMSLGFSILLGTMFSRTWQLQDIYNLQKHGMDAALKRKASTNRTYIQLAFTLVGVVMSNFFILVIWYGVDPLASEFVISDQVQLTGYYTCGCADIKPWLIILLLFFLFLLCFGVYVIYNTWSFQRKALLTETRWVLLALYNVILNIVAVVPLLSFVTINDRILSLLIICSVDLSAGSITCAVLLPRVLANFQYSKTSKGSVPGSTLGVQIDKLKSKRKPSQSQEPPHQRKAAESQVEMQPTHLAPSKARREDELSSSMEGSNHPEASPLVEDQAAEPSPTDIDSPSKHPLNPDTLQWSDNPMKREEQV